jgi:hypothetical protein
MKTAYIVTDGEYSDYRIIGVFTKRDKAEACIRNLGSGRVEEYPCDPAVVSKYTYDHWYVRMDVNGDAEEVARESNEVKHGYTWWPPYGDDYVFFHCDARDAEHAVKIANEKRGQLIALGWWTTDFDVWKTLTDEQRSI